MKYFTCIALIVCGCSSRVDSPDAWINAAKSPVVLWAADPEKCSIILKDGDGKLQCFAGDYYAAKAITKSKKVGDILKP